MTCEVYPAAARPARVRLAPVRLAPVRRGRVAPRGIRRLAVLAAGAAVMALSGGGLAGYLDLSAATAADAPAAQAPTLDAPAADGSTLPPG